MSSIIDPSDPNLDIFALIDRTFDSISAMQQERLDIERQLQEIQEESRRSIARVRRMRRKVAAMQAEMDEGEECEAIDCAVGEAKDAA